jgi:RNA polymerase sigma-70 factor (ECF subfamily)
MALATCLQKLSAEQRELVMRRYEPGASVNAIASEGETTPKAISDRLRRIRHALLLCIQRAIAQEICT